jgi:hypothetical protein
VGSGPWCVVGGDTRRAIRLDKGGDRTLIRKFFKGIPSFVVALFLVSIVNLGWNLGVPVVALMEADFITNTGGRAEARVTGLKVRKCHLVRGSTVGWYESPKDVWHETPFEYLNDLTPDSSRAAGWFRQSFGIWSWTELPLDSRSVRVTVQHECGGNIRTTIAGTFPTPQ